MPADNSVYRAFLTTAARYPERPFLRAPTASGRAVWEYGAAREQVQRLCGAYQDMALTPGARVALAYDSQLEVYLHLLALNGLGLSLVPLNLAGTNEEIRYVVNHSQCRAIVSAPHHLERLGSLATGTDAIPVVDGDRMDNHDLFAPTDASEREAEAALLYTSGTTGKPKGCMLSNEYFLTMGQWYNSLKGYCQLEHTDRLITPLPPSHMNALCTSFMGMLTCGGCVIQLDRFHPKSWWRTVREERATIIHYLGVMPAILLTLPERDNEDFSEQIKFGFGAGSDPNHQAVFEERFGFPLIEAWAMTETGAGAVTIADEEPRHLGQRCIGRPAAGMEYRIVDENDQDVGLGDAGELIVRRRGEQPRKGFFSGYFRDEAATEAGWQGGWWHTGDVVRADAEGSLYFVDRRKNVIRRSGENIAAVEVEATLLRSPAVANCVVTAVPDEIRGDEVFALIIPTVSTENSQELAQEIFAHCMERLSYFKAPGYLAFVTELPLTGSQKVKRAEVRAQAMACLESGECIDLRAAKKRTVAP